MPWLLIDDYPPHCLPIPLEAGVSCRCRQEKQTALRNPTARPPLPSSHECLGRSPRAAEWARGSGSPLCRAGEGCGQEGWKMPRNEETPCFPPPLPPSCSLCQLHELVACLANIDFSPCSSVVTTFDVSVAVCYLSTSD